MEEIKEKRQLKTGTALIYIILIGVFNLLVFTIFSFRTNVFWLSYFFMMLAFAVQIASVILSFRNVNINASFFGIPLFSFSIFYLIAALAIGTLFMVFQQAGFTLALVIQTLVVATFLVIAILSLITRDVAQQIDENFKEKVFNHKTVLVDIETMVESCTDPDVKNSLYKLSDIVKYSDPMVNDAVAIVEQLIANKLTELKLSINNKQFADAKQACDELSRLYIERNRKLAISK